MFADLDEAQAAVDAWVNHYNHERPHQGIGMVAPWERFRLAGRDAAEDGSRPTAGSPSCKMSASMTSAVRWGSCWGRGCRRQQGQQELVPGA